MPNGVYSQPHAQFLLSHIYAFLYWNFFSVSNGFAILFRLDCSADLNNFVVYQIIMMIDNWWWWGWLMMMMMMMMMMMIIYVHDYVSQEVLHEYRHVGIFFLETYWPLNTDLQYQSNIDCFSINTLFHVTLLSIYIYKGIISE